MDSLQQLNLEYVNLAQNKADAITIFEKQRRVEKKNLRLQKERKADLQAKLGGMAFATIALGWVMLICINEISGIIF